MFLFACAAITGCGVAKSGFTPAKKYPVEELKRDYSLYRKILEESHPGLYWYQSKDSMDYYFQWGEQQLRDSMTEPAFRKVLTYVTSQIKCGHTSVRPSKRWEKYQDTAALWRVFPLTFKLWPDTMVVTGNLYRDDSILTRGTVVTKINGRPVSELVDTMFKFISTDGNNTTHKYQTLSNRGYFGSLFSSLFGYQFRYLVSYLDSLGEERSVIIPIYYPGLDTARRARLRPERRVPQPSRRERRLRQLNSVRLLKIDTTSHVAFMDLSSFGRGYRLKGFFRRSFKALRKNDISHLIIDVRSNGGGSVTNSTFITRFLSDHSFKVGDSLYAIAKRKEYGRYIQNDFFNRLFMTLFARRSRDGKYHFRYFERHRFKPRKKHYFDGKVYILTGGNSFSATTLFVSTIMDQENVVVVGEETGGGAYGNNAWLIPDVTLPETKVRFRLPLFRLVIDSNQQKTGHGVRPEVEALPTVEAIRRGADFKVEKALELIAEDKKSSKK